MPLNLRMATLVTEHADLIEESAMPPCLLKLCAHVEGYRAIMSAWKERDFSRHVSVVDFPTDLLMYVERHYNRLKQNQASLLG